MIPEGYTYKRCDIYTPDEFREMFGDSEIVNDYLAENPKPTYNTDDQIALRYKRDERYVGGTGENKLRHGFAGGNGGRTTKRWEYTEDARHSH